MAYLLIIVGLGFVVAPASYYMWMEANYVVYVTDLGMIKLGTCLALGFILVGIGLGRLSLVTRRPKASA